MSAAPIEEYVARAIFTSSTEKARRESAHVATWETVPAYWREQHLRSARAAIAAYEEVAWADQALASSCSGKDNA